MNKLQLTKIALLTALLVEEVRNAKGGTKKSDEYFIIPRTINEGSKILNSFKSLH